MAGAPPTQAFILRHLFFIGLLGISAGTEPDLRCPDYVASHGMSIVGDIMTQTRAMSPEI